MNVLSGAVVPGQCESLADPAEMGGSPRSMVLLVGGALRHTAAAIEALATFCHAE